MSWCGAGLVDFLELPDSVWHSPGASLEQKAAVYLRRLMTHQQLPEMQEVGEGRPRGAFKLAIF